MTTILVVVGAVLLVLVVLALVVRATARSTMVASERRLAAILGGLRPARLAEAVCLGHTDPSLPEIEGQGHLALTQRELLFSLAAPAKLLRVRRGRLTGADERGGLLVVTYRGDAGGPDCMVRWRVPDAPLWARDLRAAGDGS